MFKNESIGELVFKPECGKWIIKYDNKDMFYFNELCGDYTLVKEEE